MLEENQFDVEGFRVYLTEEDVEDISDRNDISAHNILKDECPVVAEGKFDSTGCWLFYRTYSENTEYDMKYKKLSNQVVTNRTDLM